MKILGGKLCIGKVAKKKSNELVLRLNKKEFVHFSSVYLSHHSFTNNKRNIYCENLKTKIHLINGEKQERKAKRFYHIIALYNYLPFKKRITFLKTKKQESLFYSSNNNSNNNISNTNNSAISNNNNNNNTNSNNTSNNNNNNNNNNNTSNNNNIRSHSISDSTININKTNSNKNKNKNKIRINISDRKSYSTTTNEMTNLSNSTTDKNLYLENYAKIKEYINSIDNEQSTIVNILKEKTYECIQKTREQIKNIIQTYPNTPLSICTPNNVLGGLRNTITLLTDTSILESKRGILFRGKSVDRVLKEFPKWDDTCEYPMAEAMFWFLLTNEIPVKDDLKLLSRELYCRAKKIPTFVYDYIDNIPNYVHPMSQLISTISFLESFSLFKLKYSEGILKKDYWKYVLEDAISLIAQIQVVGAYIFKKTFINNNIKKGEGMELDIDYDWSSNFAKLIGYELPEIQDLFRLYFVLHSDHEGGNASAHASHLIGSTLGNPYLSYTGCIAALYGPLHGLANQECLNFLLGIKQKLGNNKVTYSFIEKYAQDFLNAGKVIPGYGHAVLRVPDPRFLALRNFALKHFPDDPIVQILEMCYKVIPGILSATGKVKNPYPNVDCYSGSLLYHYGIKYPQYYTVLFALSRAIGVMSQLIISRGLMFPIERPKSVDIYNLKKLCRKNYVKIEEYE